MLVIIITINKIVWRRGNLQRKTADKESNSILSNSYKGYIIV